MSRGLNKAMLIGNVGNDPEMRTTAGGTQVAKVSLATNRSWTDRGGQQQEATEWHRITFFGRLAEIVEEWVHKGDRLYVEGRIEYSQVEHGGQIRYYTDIVASEMVMLGSPNGGGGQRRERSAPVQRPRGEPGLSEPDDDLPF